MYVKILGYLDSGTKLHPFPDSCPWDGRWALRSGSQCP